MPPLQGVVVPTAEPASRPGLSPAKLVEMSEQFRSSTAATANTDDGAGQAEAARELARLLLSKEGSTLQDILVDEGAKLGDAAVRRALRRALVETPSTVASSLGLGPPKALEELLAETEEDERALQLAAELGDLLAPRVREQLGAVTSAPPQPAALAEPLRTLLGDDAARKDVADGLEGVTSLSRRVGALILRRAAERASAAPSLPTQARELLVNGNTALAEAISPSGAEAEAD
jgi:hypothetical protein